MESLALLPAAVPQGAAVINGKRRSTWEVAAVALVIESLRWITTIRSQEYHRHPL